ncbi:hypothetical protein PR048_022894 [Dryococelus australis]|uniref:Uncharacterized protein n=1 Tax=Dryococelus australis TaxID=614101 RepID=A0ABQ9GSM7_9NEOP|nr:hypothetical protein PR048_022894 [Dryococelus australis]
MYVQLELTKNYFPLFQTSNCLDVICNEFGFFCADEKHFGTCVDYANGTVIADLIFLMECPYSMVCNVKSDPICAEATATSNTSQAAKNTTTKLSTQSTNTTNVTTPASAGVSQADQSSTTAATQSAGTNHKFHIFNNLYHRVSNIFKKFISNSSGDLTLNTPHNKTGIIANSSESIKDFIRTKHKLIKGFIPSKNENNTLVARTADNIALFFKQLFSYFYRPENVADNGTTLYRPNATSLVRKLEHVLKKKGTGNISASTLNISDLPYLQENQTEEKTKLFELLEQANFSTFLQNLQEIKIEKIKLIQEKAERLKQSAKPNLSDLPERFHELKNKKGRLIQEMKETLMQLRQFYNISELFHLNDSSDEDPASIEEQISTEEPTSSGEEIQTEGPTFTQQPTSTVKPSTEGPPSTVNQSTEGPTSTVKPSTEGPPSTVNQSTEGPTSTVKPSTEGPPSTVNQSTEGPTFTVKPLTDKQTSIKALSHFTQRTPSPHNITFNYSTIYANTCQDFLQILLNRFSDLKNNSSYVQNLFRNILYDILESNNNSLSNASLCAQFISKVHDTNKEIEITKKSLLKLWGISIKKSIISYKRNSIPRNTTTTEQIYSEAPSKVNNSNEETNTHDRLSILSKIIAHKHAKHNITKLQTTLEHSDESNDKSDSKDLTKAEKKMEELQSKLSKKNEEIERKLAHKEDKYFEKLQKHKKEYNEFKQKSQASVDSKEKSEGSLESKDKSEESMESKDKSEESTESKDKSDRKDFKKGEEKLEKLQSKLAKKNEKVERKLARKYDKNLEKL